MASKNVVLIISIITIFSFHFLSLITAYEFQVGGSKGWVVPPSNDTKVYNDWASENRFKVGDSIQFKYKKDSVMAVDESEYKKCSSTSPDFYDNSGNTVYKFRKSGPFYFISGSSGHCKKGQRMIVKVMPDDGDSKSNGHKFPRDTVVPLLLCGVVVQFILSNLS